VQGEAAAPAGRSGRFPEEFRRAPVRLSGMVRGRGARINNFVTSLDYHPMLRRAAFIDASAESSA
jgi:hypothetical protein